MRSDVRIGYPSSAVAQVTTSSWEKIANSTGCACALVAGTLVPIVAKGTIDYALGHDSNMYMLAGLTVGSTVGAMGLMTISTWEKGVKAKDVFIHSVTAGFKMALALSVAEVGTYALRSAYRTVLNAARPSACNLLGGGRIYGLLRCVPPAGKTIG